MAATDASAIPTENAFDVAREAAKTNASLRFYCEEHKSDGEQLPCVAAWTRSFAMVCRTGRHSPASPTLCQPVGLADVMHSAGEAIVALGGIYGACVHERA